ncbi:hypothetical protein CAPTEDRAFT_195152 [Capitella teleta]|uniref:Major facilitator superfamily (MFS) profile domain-containing protein n=1 Tax=Capitella teleta TaxID=283909 RepID=R7VKN9_CAPTE|nr:hypothetical protein CAPTEDRAFT_195152 [Capitella teleta]|eukprot:ELU16920.1 hypothetical protein CAPTEDRAFT_195152 [Capitella teleta]
MGILQKLKINTKLLPVKITYFFVLGAVASLLPYLAVYMKQLGLSPSETAIIYGTMPFIGAFVRALVGALADKLQKHKLILMLCCLLTGVLHGCLLLVPNRRTIDIVDVDVLCGFQPEIIDCTGVFNNGSALCCEGVCLTEQCFEEVTCMDVAVEARQNHSCWINDVVGVVYDGKEYDGFNCTTGAQCSVRSQREVIKFDETFWMFFWVCLAGQMFFAPVFSLVDAITYDYISDDYGKWGVQRMWGTVGFAAFGLISGLSMDMFRSSAYTNDKDYTLAFLLYAILNILASITVCTYNISSSISSQQIFRNICSVLSNIELLFLVVEVFVCGIYVGLLETFLYWHLSTLGAPLILNGLCMAVNVLPEILLLFFAGKIIKRIGHLHCLHISMIAYAARFLALSFLRNPWFVLLIEPLQALCFSLMYASASSYASLLTPPGLSGTVQGLIGAVYFGTGKGVGSIVGGVIFEKYQAVVTFQAYSVSAFAWLLFSALVDAFVIRPRKKRRELEERNKDEELEEKEKGRMLSSGDGEQ